MTQINADIVYYIVGFISKSVKKVVTCVLWGDILGEHCALEINIESMIPEDCKFYPELFIHIPVNFAKFTGKHL